MAAEVGTARLVAVVALAAALAVAAVVVLAGVRGPGPQAQHAQQAAPGERGRPAPASAGTRPSGTGTIALDWGDLDRTPARAIARGDYVVIQAWEHARLRALHRANPALRVLMYKDVSAVVRRPHESGVFATGLGYAEARRGGWLLTDARGRRLEWSDWPGLFPVDVGDRGYQDAWAANVLAELRRHPWDGVMLDDTLTGLSHPTVGGRVSVQIPTDAAMYRATSSFLARVGPRLRRAGHLAVPNVTVEWDTWRSTLRAWTRHVSGWENEYFVKWGLGREPRFGAADWRWKVRMAAWCARRRVPLLAVTYGSGRDRATQVYHRATWLLTWNGVTGAGIYVPQEPSASHRQPAANQPLGRPAGPDRVVAGGLHRRAYTRGTVVVNPTGRTRTTRVAGEAVRLAPRTARIVRQGPRGWGPKG
ncbi:putative glycoside hydrolase [Nocardioides marmotae]|uniref:putative glycoside hydrolase n=1 Tax=Nocardioides marmotae TaxID=2663857 RepID=UPI0012B5F3CD|nr:putative glycoside hydrolase [Nocardioides marmotae]MBC9733912.1 hypothetical protein [Nocardioides marmotae]MTB85015.1 hypothetical protein [Nocardioides marmotae]